MPLTIRLNQLLHEEEAGLGLGLGYTVVVESKALQ